MNEQQDHQNEQKPLDVIEALNLRLKHKLSYNQIAKIKGVSKQRVHQVIAHLLPDELTKQYQDNSADVWDTVTVRMLKQLDAKRLKKMSGYQAAMAAGLATDKARAIRGQRTGNEPVTINVIDFTKVEGNRDAPQQLKSEQPQVVDIKYPEESK